MPAKTPKAPTPCRPLQRIAVEPGAHLAVDVFQGSQLADPPSLYGYRVELLNAKGRSAGPSAIAYVAGGAAPATVESFRAEDVDEGIRLVWRKDTLPVQIRRALIPGSRSVPAATNITGKKSSNAPDEILLSAGDRDNGGMIDTSAIRDVEYRYSAIRVRTSILAGQSLKVSSAGWTDVTHRRHDAFPPPIPAGLAVVPGFGGSPSVDLSWEPVAAGDLAGYLVYRKTGSNWTCLTSKPIEPTSYRDATAAAGTSYTYRVTSIDQTGNESLPGAEVQENPGP